MQADANNVMPKDKRSSGIGSSEIAAICGLNKWRGPIDVYMSKLGLVEEQADNDNLWFGRELEPVLIKRYEQETGHKVTILHPDDMPCRHDKYPWFMYSPDGLLLDDPFNPGILEAKTTGYSHLDEWGETGTDEIPQEYLIQCQWLMEGAGAKWADVPVLFMGSRREFRIYRIARDDELIATLIEKGKEFWENHVIPQVPPPVDAAPGWDKYFKAKYPKDETNLIELPIDADFNLNIDALKGWTIALKDAEYHKTHFENLIKETIGNHAGIISPVGKITWKKSKDRTVVDWEKAFNDLCILKNVFATDAGKIVRQHTTTKPGPRVFKTYFTKENE